MAQRVHVQLIDDLNGEDAQETVRFALDGTEYEIDLTAENADKFRSALAECADKGRKVTGRKSGSQSASSSSSTKQGKREDTQRIRQWAQDNGHNPSSRGRLHKSIVEAYHAAQG